MKRKISLRLGFAGKGKIGLGIAEVAAADRLEG
jgi:hypothetical protein